MISFCEAAFHKILKKYKSNMLCFNFVQDSILNKIYKWKKIFRFVIDKCNIEIIIFILHKFLNLY